MQILVKFQLLLKQAKNGLKWILDFSLSDIGLLSEMGSLYRNTMFWWIETPFAGSNPISLKEIKLCQNTSKIWAKLTTDKTTYQIIDTYFAIQQYHILLTVASCAHKLGNIWRVESWISVLLLIITAYICKSCQICWISHIWKKHYQKQSKSAYIEISHFSSLPLLK